MIVAMVEDEATIADRIERLTRTHLGDKLTALRRFDTVHDALDHLAKSPIDLLLLDLNIHGQDGYDVLRHAASESFHTIVISGHTERAITAFELGVLDFVPKPFSKKRLAQALDRIDGGQGDGRLKHLAVRKTGAVELVPLSEIRYIKGADYCSEILLKDGSQKIHAKTLTKLMDLLPADFARIHKSYIVNMREAVRIQTFAGSKYELEMHSGDRLPVGRTKVKDLTARYFAGADHGRHEPFTD